MLLQVNNLRTTFKNNDVITKAVDGISFEIANAEIVGIVGQSGSGKSVTALSIMQLFNHSFGVTTSGEILFQYNNSIVDLLKLNTNELYGIRGKEIAIVFQEPMTSLNPVIKCGVQIAEAILLHHKISKAEAFKRTIELLKKVELNAPETVFNAYPFQLSGGQKQRVMIAMAISCNPKLLIADEPTSSIDTTLQNSILALLKKIQSETGMSIIFISHHLPIIAQIANRIMVMYNGKIVEQGDLKDVFHNPKHLYTKALINCIPTLQAKGKALPTLSDDLNISIPSIRNERNNKEEIKGSIGFDKSSTIQNQEPLLIIENLTTNFTINNGFINSKQQIKAIDDVSFVVMKGDTLGLVGESGSGKTTLARSIIRLIEPNFGSIVYDGKIMLELNRFEMREMRKRIQLIFQDPYSALNPRLTVGEVIAEPLRVYRLFKDKTQLLKRVSNLLDKVNLPAIYYNRYPHELSGGQRQRIVIARALSLNPEFIICDECVSALDVAVQAQILNLLNDLKQEFNLTYMFISHDLNVVNYMSDKIVVMQKGKIVEQGLTAEIFKNPQTEYTRRLIDALPKGITA